MPDSPTNALEVTVSELSGKLKRTVEETFGYVRVRGEISGYRGPHSSGHSYFSLKDERARLEAVIWRGQASKLKHKPEEGLEVVASGKLTTYPGSSKYQIVIDALEPAGAGALMALLEERRRKLTAEGLFAAKRKQPLPFMPKTVGVVTSPTGAVIRDILHRISDRFPVHVIVWPVRVQGETSGREVANGVFRLSQLETDGPIPRPDVIIVARGGGSMEDLWGFNDEALVRAVADCPVPVISAVGHETDWTLIDHAADWRAPTPTAAAERAVPVKADLEATVADLGARLRGAMRRLQERRLGDLRSVSRGLRGPDTLLAMPRRAFDEAAGRLERSLITCTERAAGRYARTADRLSPQSLRRLIANGSERLDDRGARLTTLLSAGLRQRRERFADRAQRLRPDSLVTASARARQRLDRVLPQLELRMTSKLETARVGVDRAGRLLDSLSHKGVLARGYAVIRDEQDAAVTSIAQLQPGSAFQVEMQDGKRRAVAEGTPSQRKAGPAKAKPQAEQGNLF